MSAFSPMSPRSHPRSPSTESQRAVVTAASRRQLEDVETRLGQHIQTVQLRSEASKEALRSWIDTKLAGISNAVAKNELRVAELLGRVAAVSDEMQSQVRRRDAFDKKLAELRRELQEDLRQKVSVVEKAIQETDARSRVANQTADESLKRQAIQIRSLEGPIMDWSSRFSALQEDVQELARRICVCEEQRGGREGVAAGTEEVVALSSHVATITSEMSVGMVDLKRRLDEDAKVLQQLQEQVCLDGSRLEEHEQRIRAVRTSMEQQVELAKLEARDAADRLKADVSDDISSKLRDCRDKIDVNIGTLSSRLDEHRDAHEELRQQLLIRGGRDTDKLDSSALSVNGFAQDDVSEIAAEQSLCSQRRNETTKSRHRASAAEEKAHADAVQDELLRMRTRVELVEARLGSVLEEQLDRTEQPQPSDALSAVASRDLYTVVSKVAEHEDTLQVLVERSTVVQNGLSQMSEQLRNHVDELQTLARTDSKTASATTQAPVNDEAKPVNEAADEPRASKVLAALDTFEERLAKLKDVLDMETNTRLDLDPRVSAVESRTDALQQELQEVVSSMQALTRITAEAAEGLQARGAGGPAQQGTAGHSKADAAAGEVDPVKEDLMEMQGILREVILSKEQIESESLSRRTSLTRASFITAMSEVPDAEGGTRDRSPALETSAAPTSTADSPPPASKAPEKEESSPETPRRRLMSVRTFVGGAAAGERQLDSMFAAEAVKRRSMAA